MTDETQIDEVETEVESQTVETVEATESTPDSSPETPAPNGYEKRINTLTKRLREAERQLKQNSGSQKVTEAIESKAPTVPDLPDPNLAFDDKAEYQRQVQAYNEALRQEAEWKAEQKIIQKEQQRKREESEQAQINAKRKLVTDYVNNGAKVGLSAEQMYQNEQVLSEVGMSAELAAELYADENGPRIVDYLAKNYDELSNLAGLPLAQAVRKIEREIRSKALNSKPKVTNAPDPIEPSSSSSPVPDEWGNLANGYNFQ